MFVLQPGEGRSIDLGGFAMCVKASAAETEGSFTLLEADEPPGFGPPMHIHHDAAEAFYVLVQYRRATHSRRALPWSALRRLHGFRVGNVPRWAQPLLVASKDQVLA